MFFNGISVFLTFKKLLQRLRANTAVSRGLALRILGVISLSLVMGCSLRIGEKPAQNIEINLGDQVGCLSDIGTVLSQFLNGEIADEELNKFGDCAIFSIQTFENYTVGEKASEYHPGEIRHFLQQYFLKEKVISDELLNQIMNLKILILGGNKDSITRSELNEFVEIVRIWKKEFVSLNRYMKIYNWDASSKLQREFPASSVDAAIAALKSFSVNFLKTFKGRLIRYDWNNFEILLNEFRQFTNWSQLHSNNARPTEHWTLFIQTFRKVSFDESHPTIVVEDMIPMAQEVADWFGVLIKYQYFLKGQKVNREPGLTHLNSWIGDLNRLLTNAVLRHPNEEIHYDDIHQLLLALEKFFTFPLKLKADDIHEYFPGIFQTVLSRRYFGKIIPQLSMSYFRREYLLRAMAIYNDWYEIQSYLSRNYSKDEDASASAKSEVWFNPNVTLHPVGANNTIGDLRRIIRGIPPIFRKDESMTFLVELKKAFSYQVSHDFYNLSRMNLYRMFIGLAMRGYAKSYDQDSIMNSSMTADELQGLYEDLKPLGVKLGLLDPRSRTAGLRSFNEANLFTYVSDGLGPDAKMSFEEGMLLVGYLWSGSSLSKTLYTHLIQRCDLGVDDIRSQKKIHRNCVETNLGLLIRDNLTTMPGLQQHLLSLDHEKLNAYTNNLLVSAWSSNSSDEWVEKSELDVVSMIIHYSESVMTRFNQDADQFLERDEVNAAIPLFAEFIRLMGKASCNGNMNDKRVKDVFRHIVETGEIPQAKNWWSDLGLMTQFWNRRGKRWNPQLDRSHITSVFASIIAKSLRQSEKPVSCEE